MLSAIWALSGSAPEALLRGIMIVIGWLGKAAGRGTGASEQSSAAVAAGPSATAAKRAHTFRVIAVETVIGFPASSTHLTMPSPLSRRLENAAFLKALSERARIGKHRSSAILDWQPGMARNDARNSALVRGELVNGFAVRNRRRDDVM
jgi:hypothetical protein